MIKKNNFAEVFVGMGSNMDDPRRQITTALTELNALPQTHLIVTSSLYRTPPLGPQNQPDFINAVVQLNTQLSPEMLLRHLQMLEQQHHRVRQQHWGPRSLDLDILLYGSMQCDTPNLTIPHKELENRNFVLIPLYEIAPHLVLPNGKKIAKLAEKCEKIIRIN